MTIVFGNQHRTQMKSLALDENEFLFGSDSTEGIMAVGPVGDELKRLFIRKKSALDGGTPFRPFLLAGGAMRVFR